MHFGINGMSSSASKPLMQCEEVATRKLVGNSTSLCPLIMRELSEVIGGVCNDTVK